MSSSNDAPSDVGQMLRLGIAAAERGEYDSALLLLKNVYQLVPPDKFPQGLSYYGLCLAHVEHQNKAGAEFCKKAIDLQVYEGRHWANMVRVYVAAKNRRKAVEILERGLKNLKDDAALLRVREEIGYRRARSLKFLHRRHPVNKIYSRHSAIAFRRARVAGKYLLIVVWLAILAWIVMWIIR